MKLNKRYVGFDVKFNISVRYSDEHHTNIAWVVASFPDRIKDDLPFYDPGVKFLGQPLDEKWGAVDPKTGRIFAETPIPASRTDISINIAKEYIDDQMNVLRNVVKKKVNLYFIVTKEPDLKDFKSGDSDFYVMGFEDGVLDWMVTMTFTVFVNSFKGSYSGPYFRVIAHISNSISEGTPFYDPNTTFMRSKLKNWSYHTGVHEYNDYFGSADSLEEAVEKARAVMRDQISIIKQVAMKNTKLELVEEKIPGTDIVVLKF